MDLISLIISLVSGGVGGNLAGSAFKQNNLGPIVNTIAGLVGGAAGDFILKAYGIINQASVGVTESGSAVAHTASSLDLGQILATVGTSGVSGAALLAVVTLIKNALSK